MPNEYLVLTGCLCLTIALVEAWMLVISISKPTGMLARSIPGTPDLLRSHIDYLMMSMFLFIFFGLFIHFRIHPNRTILLSMCIGSIGNPLLFLVRAIRTDFKAHQPPLLRAAMGLSCIFTTTGYFGGIYFVAAAAAAAIP